MMMSEVLFSRVLDAKNQLSERRPLLSTLCLDHLAGVAYAECFDKVYED